MAKLPSFQFYPGDWLKDPALRRCSHAAKGVWIDLICLMFESDERGVLISGSQPWSQQEMALAIGGNSDATVALIRELLSKGVARERSDGALFCARMVKDERIRRTRQIAGQKGGNPALLKQIPLLVKQIPKQITEDEDEGRNGVPGRSEEEGEPLDEMIAEIYAEYPLKVGRPAAFKAISMAIRRGYEPSLLREKASDYAHAVKGTDTMIPNPSTWFNQDRFNDEPSTWTRQHRNGDSVEHLLILNKAKEARMVELKRRHYSDTQSLVGGQYLPMGWRDEKAKAEYFQIKSEITSITEQIAGKKP